MKRRGNYVAQCELTGVYGGSGIKCIAERVVRVDRCTNRLDLPKIRRASQLPVTNYESDCGFKQCSELFDYRVYRKFH